MADIKVTLGVDGESSFKTSIKESTDAVKEMKSQLSLAASKYALTGDKAQYLKDKAAALKGEIEAQKGVVEAIQGALQNASAKYGDASTKTMQWRTRLNMANTALNTMQSELAETEEALGGIGESAEGATENTEALGESIDGINEEGSLDNLLDGLQKVGEFAANAAKSAWEIGTALWGGTVEASDWADEILTLGTEYGISTKTLQGWQYASNLIDTNVETILAARQKMIKNMASPTQEVDALWRAMGINTYKEDGSGLRDANEVFWEAIEALGQIENETDRDAAAMMLFGKRAAELNPLIEAGREAWEATVKEADELGVILDDADVQKLGDFNDELQKMQSVAESMKLKFYAALAPGMTVIAEALKEAGIQLSAFLESAEGKAAIEQLGNTMAKFVTTLVEKLPQILPLLSKLAEALTELLSFVADNAEGIMAALGGLFVGGKASQFAGWLGGLPLFKGLFGGGGGGAAAGTAGAEAAGKTGFWDLLGNTLGRIAVPAAVATTTVVAANTVDAAGTARYNEHYDDAGAVARAQAGELSDTARAMADLYTAMAQIQDDPGVGLQAMRDFFQGIDQNTLNAMHELMPDLAMWQDLPEITPESVNEYLANLPDFSLLEDAEAMLDQIGAMFADGGVFAEGGQTAGESFAEGLEGTVGNAEAAGEAVGDGAEGGAAGTDLSAGGNNAGSTFVNALLSWVSSAFAAGASLGGAAAEGLSASLEIASPSKVMREMGGFVAEGFADGITDGIGMVEDAVYSMSDATVGSTMKHQNGRPGGDMAAMIANALNGVVVQIDGQDAGRILAPTVSVIMGDEADAWRYETE